MEYKFENNENHILQNIYNSENNVRIPIISIRRGT